MAKASSGQTVRVNLCKPLPHQLGPHRHPARYHLRNWGRRTGKDTLGFTEVNIGRGPVECPHPPGHCQRHLTGGRSCWAGLRDGLDVVWLAPAHPQADLLWLEQIVPRCNNPAYEIHTQERRVKLVGGGSLWVKSAADHDTINSIRGMGQKLGGVIVNEAAHLDLEYALTNVIAAATLDKGAWVTLQSTPMRGSFFNQLCFEAKDGSKDPSTWHYTHLTFRDNLSLPVNAEQSLSELIKPGTDAWREEVEAELLVGGSGLVVPMWDIRVHGQAPDPPASWPRAAGLDWGMRDPTVLVCGAQGPEDTIIWYEATFRDMTAYKVGFTIGRRLMKLPWIEYIAGDTQMWDRQATGPTIAERFQAGLSDAMGAKAVQLVPANKGPGSVEAGVNLLQELMTWSGDPLNLKPWQRPRLTIHPRCETLISTLGRLVLDVAKPGKPVTIKTGQNDHAADALRYYLASRPPKEEIETVEAVEADVHPGFDVDLKRRRIRHANPIEERAADRERWRRDIGGYSFDFGGESDLVEFDGDV